MPIQGRMLDEAHVRRWFSCVDLDQASDTLMICVGIIQGRQAAAPKRKRRDLDPGSQGLPEGMTVHSAPRRSDVK